MITYERTMKDAASEQALRWNLLILMESATLPLVSLKKAETSRLVVLMLQEQRTYGRSVVKP